MAKKSTPQIWNLTVSNEVRRLLYNLVEAWKTSSRKESKEQVQAMEALEASSDFVVPMPALNADAVNRVADLLKRFGVVETLVEQLAKELCRASDELPSDCTTIRITLPNAETILTAYDSAVGAKTVNGAIARAVMPFIEAFEQAREGRDTSGVMSSDETEDADVVSLPQASS